MTAAVNPILIDPETAYATKVLLRLADLDLSEAQIYGLFGRLARVPGAAAALDAALDEIATEAGGSA